MCYYQTAPAEEEMDNADRSGAQDKVRYVCSFLTLIAKSVCRKLYVNHFSDVVGNLTLIHSFKENPASTCMIINLPCSLYSYIILMSLWLFIHYMVHLLLWTSFIYLLYIFSAYDLLWLLDVCLSSYKRMMEKIRQSQVHSCPPLHKVFWHH